MSHMVEEKVHISVISNRSANKTVLVNEWVSIIIIKRNNEKRGQEVDLIHTFLSIALEISLNIIVIDHYCDSSNIINITYNRY